jgi:AcrR family transcriptional regulator
MPTLTFEKLKEDKKKKLIKEALLEFANKSYYDASISEMVKNIGISKGSIYQYFENKKDLYFFLIKQTNLFKQQFIENKLVSKNNDNFFELLEHIYNVNYLFDKQFDTERKFLWRVQQENNEEVGNIYEQVWKQSVQYYTSLLLKEQQKGYIRNDININIIATFVVQSNRTLAEVLFVFPQSNPEQYIKEWINLLKSSIAC